MSNTDSQKFRDALELFELCIYFIPGLKKIFFYFFVDRLTYWSCDLAVFLSLISLPDLNITHNRSQVIPEMVWKDRR